jgi:hypothetical protein
MKSLEQAVADIFNDHMRYHCNGVGTKFQRFSLGGQDRDTGADYLISNSSDFALIEFKHSEAELVSERNKSRREQLCLLLSQNKKMRDIHDKCHFIAWRDSVSGVLRCAPYRTEICNQLVFPNCASLRRQRPLKSRRIAAETYCDQFVSPPPERHAAKGEFEAYLAWLMQDASGSDRETVELMAKGSVGCTAIRFDSVDAAYRWMQGVPGFSPKKRTAKP